MTNLLKLVVDNYFKAMATETCTACSRDASEHKNDTYLKEYNISGLCDKCQDDVFNTPEEGKL